MSKNLKILQAKYKKLHEEALPFLMFLLGLITSAILDETTTIFHEFLREWAGPKYVCVQFIIFFGCLLLLGYIYYLVHRDYIGPLAKVRADLSKAMKRKK